MSYIWMKGSIKSHVFWCIIPLILSPWFHTALELLLLYIILLLIWGSAFIRVWRYRASTQENPALIHTYQLRVTFLFFAMLSLCALGLVFQVVPTLVDWIWILLSLVILSLLAVVITSWQEMLLEKAERSTGFSIQKQVKK